LEQRGTIFVEAMLVVAVIGVLAFLIGLLIRAPQRQQAGASGAGQPSQSPRWYEFTLALLLLAAIAAFAIWIISTGKPWVWGENIEDWQTDTRTIAFAAIMVALGVIGLGVSLIYALVQSAPSPAVRRPIAASAEGAAPGAVPSPSPLRILGLLLLVVAIILLCWIALPAAQQHGLFVQLIYPATLGLSLVLLFDKATRTWGTKGGAETFREWLFCDLLVFLLVLAFLHLRGMGKPEAYTVSFWDLLNVVLFFAAFWIVDRTAARGRFLFAYGYLVVLPVLLLIWDSVLGVATQASWWATMWPFLIVAAVFFVLEAVTLASSDGDRQTLPAVKDVVFVVIYAVLLIVAVKSYA
jgi:multidrug transporter EmrE-like cation transporter